MIEFYDDEKKIAWVESSMVPPVGTKINIRKKTWLIVRVTYALDYADEIQRRQMRANVDLVVC